MRLDSNQRIQRVGVVLFGVAALFYVLTCSRFFVGSFYDDARDILAARSILLGGYNNLQTPGHPHANFPLPGFPLILAPFLALVRSHLDGLRVIPIGFTLLSGFLFERLLRGFLTPGIRYAVVALFLFNPITVFVAQHVIADSAYLAFLLASALLFAKALEVGSLKSSVFFAAVLAATTLIRPEGCLAVFTFSLAAFWAHRRRLAATTLVIAPVPWIALWIFNHARAHSGSGYVVIWSHAFKITSESGALLRHAGRLAKVFTLQLLAAWPVPFNPTLEICVAILCVGFLVVLLARSVRYFSRFQPGEAAPSVALGIYFLAHLLLHLAWPVADPHYLWPLLPLVLFFLAVACWPAVSPVRRNTLYAVFGFLILTYGLQASFTLRDAINPSKHEQLPVDMLRYIAEQTPKDAYLLAPDAPVVTLYTGRHSLALLNARNPEDFYEHLKASGVTHVLLGPVDFMYVNPGPNMLWERFAATVRSAPTRYRLLYDVPSEKRALFEVLSPLHAPLP